MILKIQVIDKLVDQIDTQNNLESINNPQVIDKLVDQIDTQNKLDSLNKGEIVDSLVQSVQKKSGNDNFEIVEGERFEEYKEEIEKEESHNIE